MPNAPYNPAGGKTYNLSGSIGSTDTSFTLASFLEPVTNTPYTMDLLNTQIIFFTIGPKTTSSEFVSATGITQNVNGTATITGVTRGLAKKYPFSTSSAFKLPHSGKTPVILSDAPQVFQEYLSLNNDETVGGIKTFTLSPIVPTGGTGTQAANNQDIANAISGASGTATNLIFGTVKLSVAAVSGPNPIVVGNNDPRVTTPLIVSLGGTGQIALTANALLAGGTTTTGVVQQTGLGTTTQVLHGNASGIPTFGAVVLTSDVSGILPVANGGTGSATPTFSFVGAVTTNNYSGSSTQNSDTTFTCNFQPSVITLYYKIQGVNSVSKFSIGIASFLGTTLTGKMEYLSNASAGNFADTTTTISSSPIVAGVTGSTNGTVTLSVLSVSATNFIVRAAFSNGGNPISATYYPVATV